MQDLLDAFQALPATHLAIVAVCVSLVGFVAFWLISRTFTGKRPPIFEGIPIIGGLIKFTRGPMNLMREGYGRHGEVFTVPVAHKRITFLIGPYVVPHFFKATDEQMSQEEVYRFNVPTFGPGVVFAVDHKTRSEQFRMFAEALKSAKLKTYVPHFVREAEEFFKGWGDEGIVDIKKQFDQLILATASRTLLGREAREQMFQKVCDLFHDLDSGMAPISVLMPYLPIPIHNRRDRARVQLGALFKTIVDSRRASGVKENDLLQAFIDARYQMVHGGRELNDQEITGLLIASLFAGQHTSTITSSWTTLFMAAHKEVGWNPALEEQKALIAEMGEEITFDALQKMDVLHRRIEEALRLEPPLILVLRQCKQSYSVTDSKGRSFVIPQGDVCAVSPSFHHRLPTVFNNPDNFDPERFHPDRAEDKRVPFSFVGFGAGRHGCMGSNFAFLQIKTVLSLLLRNFELELLDPFPEPDYDSMVVGPKPCRIRYRRRTLST